MIIDAHNHAKRLGPAFPELIREMDERGIDRMWLLTKEQPDREYAPRLRVATEPFAAADAGPVSFAATLACVERRPDRFVFGFAPDPRRPDAIDRLRTAISLYGVRVCGELKLRMMADDPDALRLYRFAGERGLPVTLHLDGGSPNGSWWYGGGLAAFERALLSCPETVFLGHAPDFWAVYPGGGVDALLTRHPNLCCDLAGGACLRALSACPDEARRFLTGWRDRVLFGRDLYDDRLLTFLTGLGLAPDVLGSVLGGNALRLTGMAGSGTSPSQAPRSPVVRGAHRA